MFNQACMRFCPKVYFVPNIYCKELVRLDPCWLKNGLFAMLLGFSVTLYATTPEGFLPPEKAFQVTAEVLEPNLVNLNWEIAGDCYLYQHRFTIESATSGIKVSSKSLPEAENKQDPIFGLVKIYKKSVSVNVALQRVEPKPATLHLKISYQGCSESGMCYLPEQKVMTVELPEQPAGMVNAANQESIASTYTSEQDQIVATLNQKPIWFVVASFFGFGLLLAFTPCVFPMLPIISGIVVGQGRHVSQAKAFSLSLCYVLASALTYTVFGVIAGLFGSNIQAVLQTPWVIAIFSGLFVVLALPMFGVFELQIPSFLQSKLTAYSTNQQKGGYWGAGIMGVFSALIIGPCVTAPLAGALLYIGQTGDAVLGGVALFALGMGMGVPLLLVGTFAGRLLPKAGAWMDAVKSVFGIGLMAVAIWLMSRIIPSSVTLALWLLLAILPLVLLMRHRRWRLVSFTAVAYGLLLWQGWSGHYSAQIPEIVCEAVQVCEAKLQSSLAFRKVNSLANLYAELDKAKQLNKPVILDFYADWCTTCVEMKHSTFAAPSVHAALSDIIILQADVTGHTEFDKALLRQFNLIGPPAILFFGTDHKELSHYRVIGYINAENFLKAVGEALQPNNGKPSSY